MTDDEIVALWRQHKEVMGFAKALLGAERERIIAANAPEIEKINAYIKALEKAVEDEREACAKVCEDMGRGHGSAFAEFDCAAAIRARGQA